MRAHPRPLPRLALALALLLAGAVARPPAPVAAAECTVTSTADSGNNTLRAALANSNTFAGSTCTAITVTATGTINLQSTLPTITRALTIAGPGQGRLTIRPEPGIAPASRFLLLVVDARPASGGTPGMAVALSGLTLAGGRAKANQFGSSYGGDLRSWGANLTLTDVTLKDATGAAETGGAGAYLSGGTSTLTRVTVSGNSAPGTAQYATGAGLFVDEAQGDTTVTIADSTIAGNQATTYGGGGLAIVRDSGVAGRTLSVTLTNATVGTAGPNTAAGAGGGLYLQDGALTLTNSTVSGNMAAGDGGGLYLSAAASASATLTGGTVSGNTAGGNGGGIDSLGGVSTTLTNSIVSGNTAAANGGGIHAAGAVELTNSTVSGNTATSGDGGGIDNHYRVTLTNATVSGNTAGEFGGGLNSDPNGIATLTAVTLSGNYAGNNGGGVYTSGSATLTNVTLSGNTAHDYGGGLSSVGGTATLSFVTVVGNSALVGGGLRASSTTAIQLGRSIVAGNSSPTGADCVSMNAAASLFTSQGDNVVGPPTADPLASCPVGGTDTTHAAALAGLLQPGLADHGGTTLPHRFTHALVAGSPALDRIPAAQCATTTDQRGFARPAGPRCDVGAYEARALALTTGTAGSGSGTVTPGGTYLEGVATSVTATATTGSTFVGWTVDGAPAGTTNPLPMTMDAAHSVVATFAAPPPPSPSPSPSGAPSPAPLPLVVPPPPLDQGTVTVQRSGNQATLTASPAAGQLFLGWLLSGAGGAGGQAAPALDSWANPLTLTLTQGTTATAVFAAKPAFGDVPTTDPAAKAIVNLAARGVINGCDKDAVPPRFCPGDATLRHQMAALIVRAMPGWQDETGLPSFSDNTSDTELMTRVAAVQRHGVAQGYQDEVCRERGLTPPCYGPLDTVKYGQVMLFIARALVAHGYWVFQPDDRTLFPDQNGTAGADPTTDRQTLDHRMVVTYVHYAGAPPDVSPVPGLAFTVNGVANGGWGDPSSRAWFARALWQALTSSFGADQTTP